MKKNRKSYYTNKASLTALGKKISKMEILSKLEKGVKIHQKAIKYKPSEKLMDTLIGILSGCKGIVEINKKVRTDKALQCAFGREGCAEQSVVSRTLNASTEANIIEMEQVLKEIYRSHSRANNHSYKKTLQLIDVDMTGMPCGKKAAFATKGYFAKKRNRRGRQLGRVIATLHKEIITDQVYDGKTQLPQAFQPLIEKTEEILELDKSKRKCTLIRADGHGGSVDDVNWALSRGYHLHTKEYSGKKAKNLAESVKKWYEDFKIPGRQIGLVATEAKEYNRELKRIAVRTKKKNGQWKIGVIISTVSIEQILAFLNLPIDTAKDPIKSLIAYVHFYDLRGGGVETQIREDKQGLGILNRNKKRFEAQQMLTCLNVLAHNIIVWMHQWLSPHFQKIKKYGILRMVRDVFAIRGKIILNKDIHHIESVKLNYLDPLAKGLCKALKVLLLSSEIEVKLGNI